MTYISGRRLGCSYCISQELAVSGGVAAQTPTIAGAATLDRQILGVT